jgi:hypothetical protein
LVDAVCRITPLLGLTEEALTDEAVVEVTLADEAAVEVA